MKRWKLSGRPKSKLTPGALSPEKIGVSALIIALFCGFSRLQTTIAAEPPGRAVFRILTQQKVIALTFDDGPNPESTGQIIELLKKYQARATFFVNGKNVQKYPEIVKTAYLAGNEIGNHAETHRRLIFKSQKEITREITATDQIIRETG